MSKQGKHSQAVHQAKIDQALRNKQNADIRVVMPTPMASAVASAIGGGQPQALRYSKEAESKNEQLNWYQIEDFSNTVGDMIAQTAQEFKATIDLVNSVKHVADMARFNASVVTASGDLERFTEDFVKVKTKHEGEHGFIETAEGRMKYFAIYEDYRALAAFFQGTMHHTLIEFTEFALDAKDKLIEQEKEQAAQAAPATEQAADPAVIAEPTQEGI